MATVSFRMDDTLKRQTEAILEALGLNMTTAMTMFAKTIVREQRLPLDLLFSLGELQNFTLFSTRPL